MLPKLHRISAFTSEGKATVGSPAKPQIRSTQHISYKFSPLDYLYHQKSDWWTDVQAIWRTDIPGSELKESRCKEQMWHHQQTVSLQDEKENHYPRTCTDIATLTLCFLLGNVLKITQIATFINCLFVNQLQTIVMLCKLWSECTIAQPNLTRTFCVLTLQEHTTSVYESFFNFVK